MRVDRKRKTLGFVASLWLALAAVFAQLGAPSLGLRLVAENAVHVAPDGTDHVTTVRDGRTLEITTPRRGHTADRAKSERSADGSPPIALGAWSAPALGSIAGLATGTVAATEAAWRPAWRIRSLLMVFLN